MAHAQKIIIVNQYEENDSLSNGGYYLNKVEKHEIVINYYKAADTTDQSRLTELLRSAAFFYLDKNIVLQDKAITLMNSEKKILKNLDRIVDDGMRYYHYLKDEKFTGFSQEVELLILEAKKAKFEDSSFFESNLKGEKEERALSAFKNFQINKIKEQLELEINLYLGTDLYALNNAESPLSDEEKGQLIDELNDFGAEDELKPLSFDFSDGSISLLASEDEFLLLNNKEESNSFAEDVMKALDENNEKLEKLESDIHDIKQEQERQWKEQQEANDAALQKQINDLRDLIVGMVEGKDLPSTSTSSTRPIANLPEEINLFFSTSSTKLNISAVYKLNEIVDLLSRNPQMSIVITGHADASGNSAFNLSLSQKRADAVRRELLKSGIQKERLIINYFGERDSQSVNANDRRVTIKFIY